MHAIFMLKSRRTRQLEQANILSLLMRAIISQQTKCFLNTFEKRSGFFVLREVALSRNKRLLAIIQTDQMTGTDNYSVPVNDHSCFLTVLINNYFSVQIVQMVLRNKLFL